MSSITTVRRKGKIIGYSAALGKDKITGKVVRKFFKTPSGAQAFIDSKESEDIDVGEVYRDPHRIIACVQRLREWGANIEQATEFYLKHGVVKGYPTVASLAEQLIKDKEQAGKKSTYLADLKAKYGVFVKYIGVETKVADVTTAQIKDFVYVKCAGQGKVTILNNIRCLAILFNYAITNKYLSDELNPVDPIERPDPPKKKPAVISPEDFATLLNRCLKNKWYDRVTILVLVGFCGVRMEEASKMSWSDINMKAGKVTVSEDIAKKGRHRINRIPANAMKWLEACYDARRTGRIIGDNWKNLIRSAIRFSHITYKKNGPRHSFCSYALAESWPLADVVAYMGHIGSPALVHSYYKEIVEESDAHKWWAIVPKVDESV